MLILSLTLPGLHLPRSTANIPAPGSMTFDVRQTPLSRLTTIFGRCSEAKARSVRPVIAGYKPYCSVAAVGAQSCLPYDLAVRSGNIAGRWGL